MHAIQLVEITIYSKSEEKPKNCFRFLNVVKTLSTDLVESRTVFAGSQNPEAQPGCVGHN